MCNDINHELHRGCYACGDKEDGIGLRFKPHGEGVIAEWFCDKRYESYPGIIHGGITATLLDSAMTNCLLINGIIAVTAELSVRYHESLRIDGTAIVKAVISYARPPLFRMEAEILQDGVLKAKAHAKFMLTDAWKENGYV